MLLTIFLTMTPRSRIKPRNRIIRGDAVRSSTSEKCNPSNVATNPDISPMRILFRHPLANRAEMDAGIIKNAKTVSTPAILTDSMIMIPKVA